MHPTLKKLFIGFVLVALSVLFWLFLKSLFFQDVQNIREHFWTLQSIGIFGSLFAFYGVLLALSGLLITQRPWAYGVFLAGSLPYFIVAPGIEFEILEAYSLLLVSFIVMRERMAKEIAARLTLSVESALSKGLSFALTAIAIAVSVVFYISPAVDQLKDIRIPRELFQAVIWPVESAFQQRIDTELGVLELKENTGSLDPEVVRGGMEDLKPEEKSAFENFLRPFTGGGGSAQSPYSEFSDAAYDGVHARIAGIASLAPQTKRVLALSLAITMFAIIRFLAIPVGWVIIVLTTILANMLIYVGFVKIQTVQVDKEVLEL